VVVVDDNAWADALEQQWQARSTADEPLLVKRVTQAELLEQKRVGSEVIVYPPTLLGTLMEREWLQSVPEEWIVGPREQVNTEEAAPARLPVDDWFIAVRQGTASWGRRLYGVPLGTATPVLLYRRDILEKLGIAVPQTWEEYRLAAEKLQDRAALGDLAPRDEQPWFGALEPTDEATTPTWLLLRSAAATRVDNQVFTLFDTENMTPHLASPPFIEAAEEMHKLHVLAMGAPQLSCENVRERFLAGQCALALTTLPPVGIGSNLAIGCAELPGTRRTWSFDEQRWLSTPEKRVRRATLVGWTGRVASVTREARQAKNAFRLLFWLTKDDTLKSLGPIGTSSTLFARTQLRAPEVWLPEGFDPEFLQQYGQVVERQLDTNQWTPALRLAGEHLLTPPLRTATQRILSGEQSASEALKQAAQEWTNTIQALPPGPLRRSYQASCGADS
jgi:ABC-type glycerol-3-phosphate transport system substrate-binding protein